MKLNKVSIICPLYNAEKYIEGLIESIKMQKDVEIEEVKFILTDSMDSTEDILKRINSDYEKISREEFSHSLTREKYALKAKGDIIVFITQDIKIQRSDWLFNLIKGIISEECDASFSRQIGYEHHGLERYVREVNYPKDSRIVSIKDVDELGIMSFFYSDASSAIKKEIFVKLDGYDGKKLPTNEDMYIAHKLIMNGYKIKYEADSEIVHSHQLSYKEVYLRYKSIGKFFKENSYLNEYKATKRGASVLQHVIKRSIEDRKYPVIFDAAFNFAFRFVGMQLGKRF